MVGAGLAFSIVQSAAAYTAGIKPDNVAYGDDAEVERREALRKLRRRPLEETIEQLGEGRGEFRIFPS